MERIRLLTGHPRVPFTSMMKTHERKLLYFAPAIVFFLIYLIQSIFFYYVDLLGTFTSLVLLGAAIFLPLYFLFGSLRRKNSIFVPLFYLILSLGWFFTPGKMLGAAYRLWNEQDYYLSQIILATNGSIPELNKSTIVEQGATVRVAFAWGGFVDNWHGICYDPSKEIERLDSEDLDARLNVRSWFGGDMIYVFPLKTSWYFCGFT